jgi:hypothetical protein
MWQPRLEASGKTIGRLVGSAEGAAGQSVICLLDPPEHALPREAYAEAQVCVSALYREIPADEPFLLGLQEEFRAEVQQRLRPGLALDDAYLAVGGLGIVHALSRASTRPEIVALEDPAFVSAYKGLENSAIEFLRRFAPFFEALVGAFRRAEQSYSSPELAACIALIRKFRRENAIRAADYRARLCEVARAAGVDLASPAYRGIRLYERIQQLEEAASRGTDVNRSKRELAQLIHQTATGGWIAARPAWELFRYSLTTRPLPEEELAAELARADAVLAEEPLPEPAQEVRAAAARLVQERAMTDMRLVRRGEDKGEILGDHGDVVSNLLELAAILELDIEPFQPLASYVQYADADHRLKQLARGAVGAMLDLELKRLEDETLAALARTERDRTLVAAEPVAGFLEALGRFQILHGEEYRSVVAGFRATEFCNSLAAAGVALPGNWQALAAALEANFDTLRNYFDLTILRGKDMASALFRAMKQQNLRRGIVYCDGYQHANLARWFEAREVSYSLVMPAWK